MESAGWVRFDWHGARFETRYINGIETIDVPSGVTSFDLFLCKDERDEGIRMKNRGQFESFPVPPSGGTMNISVHLPRSG
jgi:hypothetical protein